MAHKKKRIVGREIHRRLTDISFFRGLGIGDGEPEQFGYGNIGNLKTCFDGTGWQWRPAGSGADLVAP